MICKKCGKDVNENDKFCENCGNDLTRKTLVENMKEYKKQIIAFLLFVTILLAGYFGYQYYNSHKKLVNPYYKNLAKIGIFLEQKDGKTLIKDFYEGSTSDKSGLEKGDIILKVDNKKVDNFSISEIISLLQGQVGSKVKIEVLRNNKNLVIIVPRGNVEEYYDYYYLGQSVYTKYLKYENGKYYFWVRQSQNDKTNFNMKNCAYEKVMFVIDIDKQKFGFQQADFFDSKDNIITSENYTDKYGNIKFENIPPNSMIFGLYMMIKRIDDKSTSREKEQFKGFFE